MQVREEAEGFHPTEVAEHSKHEGSTPWPHPKSTLFNVLGMQWRKLNCHSMRWDPDSQVTSTWSLKRQDG